MKLFAEGGYDHILAVAADNDLPLFVFGPDAPEAFARAAKAFPSLKILIDHCGIYSNWMRERFGGGSPRDLAGQIALFDEVLAVGKSPNVALKWGHASGMFDLPAWPGEALWPILRRAVDVLGAERVMWESDYSVNQRGETWAELLFGVRGNPLLKDDEKAAVLGGTARAWLDWPA